MSADTHAALAAIGCIAGGLAMFATLWLFATAQMLLHTTIDEERRSSR